MDKLTEELRILMLEDVSSDAELAEIGLRDAGLAFTALRVDTREAFERALDEFKPSVILADYRLPGYNGRDALEHTRRTHPQIPVIMVTGALGDEAAIELLKLGARDYLLKGNLARLAPAITRALSEERGIRNRKLAERMRQESELRYRRLFEAAKDGILILDAATGAIVDANPFLLDLLSYSPQECIGKKLWEIGLFADTEESKKAFKELQIQGDIRYEDLPLEAKGGQRIDVEFVSNVYEVGGLKVIQCNIRDITERLRAARALRDSEARYKRITEGLTDYQYSVRIENGRAVETTQSPACVTVTGHTPEEFAANPHLWIEMVVPEDRESVMEGVNRALAGKDVPPMEHRIVRKDGQVRWVSDTIILFKDTSGRLLSYDGVVRDVTAQNEAERSIQRERDTAQRYLDVAGVILLALDRNGAVTLINRKGRELLGYPEADIVGKSWFTHFVPEHSRGATRQIFDRLISGEMLDAHENPILTRSGVERLISWNNRILTDESGIVVGILSSGEDITERKRDEQIIKDAKAFSEKLVQSLPDVFYLVNRQGRLMQWNERGAALFGLSPEELNGADVLNFIVEEDRVIVAEKLREAFETGSAETEARLNLKNGIRHYVLTGTRVETQLGLNVIGIGIDITERKRAEDALRRANRALKTLSAGNLALVRAKSEDELLQTATSVIIEQGGYSMAVVGYAENDPEKSVAPIAWAGKSDSEYFTKHLSWADTERGQLPVSRAIRTGTTQVCHDIASDAAFKPWREAALGRGYASNIALPLNSGGKTVGALSIYASDTASFNDEEVGLLEELANDLAYGIITLRTRKEHEHQAVLLRQSLEQSIQTIAATVEARDPYTAGHQRRVAELATAIAREMGLPEEQVDGIHFAAIIHDLGKIHIPAEILAKPGKLSDLEFSLIKAHPQSGYDILKDVRFPWPIADIVLQHHEKLDGSGYPQGLKGDQIMLESRIMTVADVVEAMSSHRPYRPGLGIDAALEEITRGRATRYCPKSVDACVALFREKGYVIPR